MSWSDVVAGRASPGSTTPAPSAAPTGDVQHQRSSLTPSTDQSDVPDATLCVALIEALRPQNSISAEAVDIRSTDVDNITYHHGPLQLILTQTGGWLLFLMPLLPSPCLRRGAK